MKTQIIKLIALTFVFAFIIGCDDSSDVIESGTYVGTIQEVVPAANEIYVQSDDGEVLELYFTNQTTLTQNGEMVPFNMLQTDQRVRVEVERVSGELNPLSVEILE